MRVAGQCHPRHFRQRDPLHELLSLSGLKPAYVVPRRFRRHQNQSHNQDHRRDKENRAQQKRGPHSKNPILVGGGRSCRHRVSHRRQIPCSALHPISIAISTRITTKTSRSALTFACGRSLLPSSAPAVTPSATGAAIEVDTLPGARKTSAPAPAVTPIMKLLVALETLSGRCMK